MENLFSINDNKNMAIALKIAKHGKYGVHANPMVGCVITKNNKIIAKGWHQEFGKEHAEINALKQINYQAKGTTLYSTLEPCSHQGKTQSCAKKIIDAKVKNLIIATTDPNPLVNGKGIAKLKEAGIKVKVGLLENQAIELNCGFFKRMQTGLPFVTCKIAASLDAKTSMSSKQSKWITSEESREDVQKLRAQNQAIMTGSDTILADNPSMTVRLKNINVTPLRVVIDSNNKIKNKKLNIFSANAPTIVFNKDNAKSNQSGKLDLKQILLTLGKKGINNVLLEAGPNLIGAMLELNLIDKFVIYKAPIIMGSSANSMINIAIDKMQDKINIDITDITKIGNDIKITGKLKK